MTIREQIWEIVCDMIDERWNFEAICMSQGIKKYEDEVADIKERIEDFAQMVEHAFNEKQIYLTNGDAEADEGCRRYHAKEG